MLDECGRVACKISRDVSKTLIDQNNPTCTLCIRALREMAYWKSPEMQAELKAACEGKRTCYFEKQDRNDQMVPCTNKVVAMINGYRVCRRHKHLAQQSDAPEPKSA